MKIARLTSMMLVAILAVGLAVVSVASAAPTFTPTGSTVTGASTTTSVLTGGGETVTCAKNVAGGGTVTSATLVAGITVHFLECTDKTSTGATCAAASGSTAGLIITNTLHGVLGLVLPKPTSGSDVALILLPVSGSTFVKISGTCFTETAVSGSIAGLANPIGTKTTKGTLEFGVTSGVQNIKEVDLSTGGVAKPKLTAFSETAQEATTDAITFGTATEIT
ncbi:MAG TPA: hypothetical protein VIH92_14885 [Solirubrobacteraceae bacterium]